MVFGLFFIFVGLFLLLWGLHGFGVLTSVGNIGASKDATSKDNANG